MGSAPNAPLRRQLLGQDDQRRIRRDACRAHRPAVLMNATASPAGAWQKLEYGVLLQTAKLIGGIRPPLTRSVLKAFLGPTFRRRPDVVDFVRRSVQSVDLDSSAWAVRSV